MHSDRPRPVKTPNYSSVLKASGTIIYARCQDLSRVRNLVQHRQDHAGSSAYYVPMSSGHFWQDCLAYGAISSNDLLADISAMVQCPAQVSAFFGRSVSAFFGRPVSAFLGSLVINLRARCCSAAVGHNIECTVATSILVRFPWKMGRSKALENANKTVYNAPSDFPYLFPQKCDISIFLHQ
jgi:hypothetical protein